MKNASSSTDAEVALARIGASQDRQLLLTAEQVVLSASRSFCRSFDLDPVKIVGRQLVDLGIGEWDLPGFQAMLAASAFGSVPVTECEIVLARHKGPIRRLAVHVDILDGGPTDQVRLLLTFTDVADVETLARQKDKLIRQQAIALQEAQHRIANSLQIVAGILMQSARCVLSEEARQCLQDAHHRVMSVAAVQRQLSATADSSVRLRVYLAQLCDGLRTSMISDPSRISITTVVEDRIVSGVDAVSLGLIVTELVINALKYAFPDDRAGRIVVAYGVDAGDWVLSVADDGVGLATGGRAGRAGLGKDIVDALSRNLGAEVTRMDCQPGTRGTITRHGALGRKAVPAPLPGLPDTVGESS